jgi:hypothetical protein
MSVRLPRNHLLVSHTAYRNDVRLPLSPRLCTRAVNRSDSTRATPSKLSESDYIHYLFHLQQTTVFAIIVNKHGGVVRLKLALVVITRAVIGPPATHLIVTSACKGPRLRSLAGTTRERKGIKKGFGSLLNSDHTAQSLATFYQRLQLPIYLQRHPQPPPPTTQHQDDLLRPQQRNMRLRI